MIFKSNKISLIFLSFLLTLLNVNVANSSEQNFLSQQGIETGSNIINTKWQLVNYLTSAGNLSLPYSEHEPTLRFDSQRVSGTSGCNQFMGNYKLEQKNLSFQGFASTQKACFTEGLSAQEQDFLKALGQVASYELDNDLLQLKDSQGKNILTFQKIRPASLTQNLWQLQQYNNGRGGIVSLISGTEIILVIDDQGKLRGNAGCNQYQSQWKGTAENFQISPPISTKKFCNQPEGIMEQETAYLSSLEKVNSWEIEGSNLVLKDAEGNRLASYQATLFKD
ncbi:protein of unknown function DUF306 Meta and HslJ [Gloeothece citriformis PCC 7424]|uniref:DUF306 domain-containing protein n=1 Tax=Gloeothece citriformis (strain PCC 7424) TaxID=65393 RepID=B7KKA7_GLOC7|nr:META domain-containing protein [Gloeothece citriformis]ACK70992.1 protein of unknown function DUF306 Meta and HslJ [Gloeothece citriformis PCC 7424]